MSASDFGRQQGRAFLLMLLGVIIVLALLAGFVLTSLQKLGRVPPVLTPSPVSLPTTRCPSPSSTPAATPAEGIWSQVQAARLFDQIAHQVETVRGISPRAEVPLSFLDEGEMTSLLDRLYAERGLETRVLPHVALGLLPDVPISLRPSLAAGIYVPEQEQLYVATGRQRSGDDDQAVLAHAYVHALQDQHFNLRPMAGRAATTDGRLAAQALVEGDATLSTALYRYKDVATVEWDHLTELIVRAERPYYGEELECREAWVSLQRFPNWEGRRFAQNLFGVGGWETINRAYANPPRSTEQVLHPERYLQERDVPTSVVVPDVGAALGEGWTLLLRDTLGEFVVCLYLDRTLPEEMAWEAADGWDGDTFVVWESENGRRTLVWRTIWDSAAEAAEFERGLVTLIPQRYPPARPVPPPGRLPGRWWETGAGAVHVCRLARYVTLVRAADLNALANIVEVLP